MLVNRIKSSEDEVTEKFLAALGCTDQWAKPWPLPNMAQVTEKEYWGWRSSYSFKAEAWVGQIQLEADGKKEWGTLILYFLDQGSYMNGGFAVVYCHQYREEKVLYFEWKACAHEFVSRNIGNCLNEYTCRHCKLSYEVDSSG
jgi:hypothetical protein